MGGSRLGRGDGMNTVTGIAFGLGWPPCAALIARAAFPRSLRGLRQVLAFWLTDALVLAGVYAAVRIGSFALGYAGSALIAAAWVWWRHKRPDRAVRALGAKSRALVEAMARRMPPARIPVRCPMARCPRC